MFEIKEFQKENLEEIYKLFYDAVHQINKKHYDQKQLDVWAPKIPDLNKWEKDLLASYTICTWDEDKKIIVGFANLLENGYIDKCFVHVKYQAKNIGLILLRALENKALQSGMQRLFADVSITAKKPMEFMGYKVEKEQIVEVRGVEFINYRMYKILS